MADQTDAANCALQKLGETRITSLADNDKPAREISAVFDVIRDAELRAHAWNFAVKRTTLPALGDAPEFGFNRQFQLPGDCLRVLQVGQYRLDLASVDYRSGLEALFRIEGRRIVSDMAAPLPIIYISRIEDVSQWDAQFFQVFCTELAKQVCDTLTQSETKFQRLAREKQILIRRALLTDAIENPPEGPADGSWLLARL